MGYERLIAGRYEIGGLLGMGGMGAVYRGLDRQTGQPVALKSLKPSMIIDDPDAVERFIREGETLRSLNHPNIVRMLDMVEQDNQQYLVMEYVGGGSLRDLLAGGERLPIEQALAIALEVADALARAHHFNIVHRDLKPDNFLLSADGTPRLADFGIARIDQLDLTETDSAMGTVAYLSPEALNDESVDARSDIWAFGVMLFEMLAGRRPFDHERVAALITAILTAPPPNLEDLRPDAPIALVDLVYRMLQKDRAARIPTMRLVAAELELIARGIDTNEVRETSSEATTAMRGQITAFLTPTPPSGRAKHNLPAQTPFVGREAELASLQQLLDDPDNRLVTILAPGGMGKTRLALEFASRFVRAHGLAPRPEARFLNGIYLVELAPLTDPANIAAAIAEASGYPFQQDDREPKQQVLDFLRQKQLLLIMDNYDHLLDGAGFASEILRAAPAVQIIATSRERLNLDGETVFHLGGMDFPDLETSDDPLEYSAVKLFVQGARRAQPGFELIPAELQYMARICGLVQGMPLAILLAAAWIEMLSPKEITAEIEQSLDFLASAQHDLPARERSIRAIFDCSWKRLAEKEREVFMRLSVFWGGFTREAAEAVTRATLRDLTTLVNKSLLRRDHSTGRYDIHELLRQYAEERLEISGEAAAARAAYSAYYAGLL